MGSDMRMDIPRKRTAAGLPGIAKSTRGQRPADPEMARTAKFYDQIETSRNRGRDRIVAGAMLVCTGISAGMIAVAVWGWPL